MGSWIKRPKDYQRIQRREHLRVNYHVPLKIKIVDKNGDALEITAESRDLSGGGISFYTNENLKEYKNIHKCLLEFTIVDKKEFYSLESNMVFSREITNNTSQVPKLPKYKYLAAFKFINTNPKTVDKLCQFCFQHQLQLKKKGLL
jgi:c-di-GMP-binding flagellar brake protein YcgR